MADSFKQSLISPSFKLLDLKEKNILHNITNADLLCSYVNKFLPHKFTTNHGKKVKNEDLENDELDVPNKPSQFENSVAKTSRAKTIEELYKRIETLRGKRASYKEKLLKKGLKNRLKKKQKLEERKNLKKKNIKLEKLKSENLFCKADNNDTKDTIIRDQPEENSIKFNKLLISETDEIQKPRNDPKILLAKLEKKKSKLKKLELKGKKEKLTEIKSKEAWDTAIQKAEGVKVKDNIELLKKSVSKIKNRKNKSKKKWEEREKLVESKKEKVQKKRQDNIIKKRKERSKKRTKMLVKKGRILPK